MINSRCFESSMHNGYITVVEPYLHLCYAVKFQSSTTVGFEGFCDQSKNDIVYSFSLNIPEFEDLTRNEQKTLLLQNLDPMFNIKSGFFFQKEDTSSGFVEQVERFSIFDISMVTR